MTTEPEPHPWKRGSARLEGLRLRPEELHASFGLSQRLSVRLGALLAAGLSVSPTLAEVLADDDELRKLVQSRHLLELAGDPAALATWLATAAGSAEASDSPVLALAADARGAPVLCLQEEILALSVWDEGTLPAIVADPGTALGSPVAPSPAAMLAPRELPAIERSFRTAADPARRIEALTQLVTLGRFDAPRRAGLLMEAMASSDEIVARSAVALLETAGLPRALADALRGLEDRSLSLRRHAIDQLRTALAASEPDPLCLAAVLLVARRVLWDETDLAARRGLVLLLGEATLGPVASADNVREVVRTLVKASLDAPAAMSVTIRRAVLRLANEAPAATAAALEQEAAGLGDDAVAVYVLALLGELPMATEDDEERFCREFVRRVFAAADAGERPNLAQLVAGLRHRGARGVSHVLTLLSVVDPHLAAEVVDCIDRLATSAALGDGERAGIRAAILAHLERATPACARAILRSRLIAGETLLSGEARAVARELTAHMRCFLLPDTWAEVAARFADLGAATFDPLAEMLVDPATDPDLLPRALDLLAHSFGALGDGRAYDRTLRERALALLCEGASAPEQLRGALIHAAGALVRSPGASPAEAVAGAKTFREALAGAGVVRQEDEIAPELVQLASCLAARPDLGADEQADCQATFVRALTAEPEDEGELLILISVPGEERAWTGPVYQATGAELRYTVTLPSAIDGLAALAAHSPNGRTFRRRFVLLHDAWNRVAAQDHWGPDCTRRLLVALARLAAGERATGGVRKLFLETLTEPMHLLVCDESDLPVARAVAELLERSSRALQRAHAFRVLGHLTHARREALAFEEAERAILLDSITRIAALRGLTAPDESTGQRLATGVWNQVRTAIRAGSPGCWDLAARLRHCVYLSEEQREGLEPPPPVAKLVTQNRAADSRTIPTNSTTPWPGRSRLPDA